MHLSVLDIHFDRNIFDIGMPNAVGSSMGMADVIAEVRTLAADLTFRHFDTSCKNNDYFYRATLICYQISMQVARRICFPYNTLVCPKET